jgi:hypothetical protein
LRGLKSGRVTCHTLRSSNPPPSSLDCVCCVFEDHYWEGKCFFFDESGEHKVKKDFYLFPNSLLKSVMWKRKKFCKPKIIAESGVAFYFKTVDSWSHCDKTVR